MNLQHPQVSYFGLRCRACHTATLSKERPLSLEVLISDFGACHKQPRRMTCGFRPHDYVVCQSLQSVVLPDFSIAFQPFFVTFSLFLPYKYKNLFLTCARERINWSGQAWEVRGFGSINGCIDVFVQMRANESLELSVVCSLKVVYFHSNPARFLSI